MNCIVLSEKILAIATGLQTLELLALKTVWADQGIWSWSTVRKDLSPLPSPIRYFFDLSLNQNSFLILLLTRLVASGVLLYGISSSASLVILFFSTWLIAIRWRGNFNGGSDSMSIVVSLGLLLARGFSESRWIPLAGTAYIAIQVTSSYWVAGFVKLRSRDWRSGRALPLFLRTPGYDSCPKWVVAIFDVPVLAKFAAYSVIAFEILFPFAWTGPRACVLFIAIAIPFHLANFWIFGLNRFVFAWLSAYPVLYFWSLRFAHPG